MPRKLWMERRLILSSTTRLQTGRMCIRSGVTLWHIISAHQMNLHHCPRLWPFSILTIKPTWNARHWLWGGRLLICWTIPKSLFVVGWSTGMRTMICGYVPMLRLQSNVWMFMVTKNLIMWMYMGDLTTRVVLVALNIIMISKITILEAQDITTQWLADGLLWKSTIQIVTAHHLVKLTISLMLVPAPIRNQQQRRPSRAVGE